MKGDECRLWIPDSRKEKGWAADDWDPGGSVRKERGRGPARLTGGPHRTETGRGERGRMRAAEQAGAAGPRRSQAGPMRTQRRGKGMGAGMGHQRPKAKLQAWGKEGKLGLASGARLERRKIEILNRKLFSIF